MSELAEDSYISHYLAVNDTDYGLQVMKLLVDRIQVHALTNHSETNHVNLVYVREGPFCIFFLKVVQSELLLFNSLNVTCSFNKTKLILGLVNGAF